MLDLSVIILTKDEELHLARCLACVRNIARVVYVVDSGSTDATEIIARENGAVFIHHEWPGNQAEQFNWAIDNLEITTEWILRLDADEYLLPELVEELCQKVPAIPAAVNGIVFKRRHIFMDRWMRHGIYPVRIMRMFRCGMGRYEQRLMDEHLVIDGGETIEMNHDFCDHNLNNLSWFCKKHVDYAVREAAEMLNLEYNLSQNVSSGRLDHSTSVKRAKKYSYARKPLFWRSFAYFLYRYFYKRAFLDGVEGFIFTFLQGWWYRTLVDAKIYEIKRKCGNDPDRIRLLLRSEYSISI